MASGEIRHAIRVTAPATRRAYVWPARHYASWSDDPDLPPMGQRFRLRADLDITGFSPQVQVILTAMKRYGLILADNGASWFISGAPDERWDNDILRELRALHGSDFQAIDFSSLMIDPNSGQAACQPSAEQEQIALSVGWNLVSLPLTPAGSTPAVAFASITGSYDVLWAHDASDSADPWRHYDPTAPEPANELNQVNERMGLWIKANQATTLTVSGTAPGATTIPLYVGWNLVGYPSRQSRPLSDAMASIINKYTAVYAYDPELPGDHWEVHVPGALSSALTLTQMDPGRGYWIYATQPCDWVVDG